jgi:UPF0271 protein
MSDQIDLNCDLGELDGDEGLQVDAQIIPLVTSVNVACGFHAGSPERIRFVAQKAKMHGVAVGAHPGYPDRQGFGRTVIPMSSDEVKHMVLYQVGVCGAILKSEGVRMQHVKPHGALYNLAAVEPDVADAVAMAVKQWDSDCILVGLAGSELIRAGIEAGLRVAHEVFADRAYMADGQLVPRTEAGAVLHDQSAIAGRLIDMVRDHRVMAIDGTSVAIQADTVCVHGDNPNAVPIIQRLVADCREAGIRFQSLTK